MECNKGRTTGFLIFLGWLGGLFLFPFFWLKIKELRRFFPIQFVKKSRCTDLCVVIR